MEIAKERLSKEISFEALKSGGPGGQHVNKVSTKVRLKWPIGETKLFTPSQLHRIRTKCQSMINKEGELTFTVQQNRSQFQNKEIAIDKLRLLIRQALVKRKKRMVTKPSKSAKEARIKSKKKRGELKQMRQKYKY
ncbi:MAG: ribosome-associated protein [Cyclobacteriaceae bacterium]|jgi:ribosome-associated protein